LTLEPLVIDGAHGEGGGQILRTALSLSALTGQPMRLENIRANRRNPGLAAQHLTAVRAAAAICAAKVDGDALGSQVLRFVPTGAVEAGDYAFDVAAAREGGSAGAATLVLQTVLLPLALADGTSTVQVRGGTHMRWSPSFDYADEVWLPALRRAGVSADLALRAWGWFPVGEGELTATIRGIGAGGRLCGTRFDERGALSRIAGRGVAANLPAHIPQRMVDRAGTLLADLGVPVQLQALRVRAASAGAGLFLQAHYDAAVTGFEAHGERGKPAEAVAEEAVEVLLAHHRSGAALDRHLADQLLLPLALAAGPSRFTTPAASRHLMTNAWVIERFGVARVATVGTPAGLCQVEVRPCDGRV